jgi:hypothetical protein
MKKIFHNRNTDTQKAIYSVYFHYIVWTKFWGGGVSSLGVKLRSPYKRKLSELWLLQNLGIHVKVCLKEQRFYLFHVIVNFHYETSWYTTKAIFIIIQKYTMLIYGLSSRPIVKVSRFQKITLALKYSMVYHEDS